MATQIFRKLCKATILPMPQQRILPAISFARRLILIHSNAMAINRHTTTVQPIKPYSSPATAKIKSVWFSATKFPSFTEDVLSSPVSFFPTSSPEAMAVFELFCCSIFSEYSSFSGYRKDIIRFL